MAGKKAGDIKDGQKKLKKFAPEQKWAVAKKVATKGFQANLKERKKDADKDDLRVLAAEVAAFKDMMGSFKLGLSPSLKKLAKSKTPDEFTKGALDSFKILTAYGKIVDANYKNFAGGSKSPTYTLGGMIKRLKKDMNDLAKTFA